MATGSAREIPHHRTVFTDHFAMPEGLHENSESRAGASGPRIAGAHSHTELRFLRISLLDLPAFIRLEDGVDGAIGSEPGVSRTGKRSFDHFAKHESSPED